MSAAVACGSPVERARDPRPAAEAAAPATATAAPAAVPTGYHLLEAAGEGFALAVPEAWHDVPDAKRQAAGAQEVAREKVALSAGPALRTTYVLPVTTRDGASQRVFGVQYVPAPEAVFVLNLSTPISPPTRPTSTRSPTASGFADPRRGRFTGRGGHTSTRRCGGRS